jgi:hypothetical protein
MSNHNEQVYMTLQASHFSCAVCDEEPYLRIRPAVQKSPSTIGALYSVREPEGGKILPGQPLALFAHPDTRPATTTGAYIMKKCLWVVLASFAFLVSFFLTNIVMTLLFPLESALLVF